MLLLGFDLETTGLDTKKARIIEIGACLWDTDHKAPVQTLSAFIHDESLYPLPPETYSLTGITVEMLKAHGVSLRHALLALHSMCTKASYLVAHNGTSYDLPVLEAEFERLGIEGLGLPLIDTMLDIEYQPEPKQLNLTFLAAVHGFVNPFPHRALFDTMSMMKIMSNYPLEPVLAQLQSPWRTLRAVVSYEDRELAKARKFRWQEIGDKFYKGMWVKRVRECNKAKEMDAPFKVVQLED